MNIQLSLLPVSKRAKKCVFHCARWLACKRITLKHLFLAHCLCSFSLCSSSLPASPIETKKVCYPACSLVSLQASYPEPKHLLHCPISLLSFFRSSSPSKAEQNLCFPACSLDSLRESYPKTFIFSPNIPFIPKLAHDFLLL